jgi:hypothetical protein
MMTKKKDIVIHEGESREIIIYRDSGNAPKVEVLLQHEKLSCFQNGNNCLIKPANRISIN